MSVCLPCFLTAFLLTCKNVLKGINIFEGAGRRHETGRAGVTEAAPTVQGHSLDGNKPGDASMA